MVSTPTPVCDFGWPAPDFNLPGVDGKNHTLADVRGEKGLLVMFICNHCPYVKAVLDRIVRDARELKPLGINCIAVMSNDPAAYPEDSWDNMVRIAREMDFPFPYVLDETQEIAQATAPCVRRISSASTIASNCNTAAAWTLRARRPRRRIRRAICSRR